MGDLRVAHWNGTTWKDEGNGGTTGNNSEGTIQSLNAISSFSPFTLASIGTSNPLPVRFISFDVRLNENKTVLLQWNTSFEIHNDHFELQRSSNKIEWTNLQTIRPLITGKYFYVDLHPYNGNNYYRVKQVDFNSDASFTEIKMIHMQAAEDIYLWPNPVATDINLMLPYAKGTVEITDEEGRTVVMKTIQSNIMSINVSQLGAGIYFVRIKSGTRVFVEKFVKM